MNTPGVFDAIDRAIAEAAPEELPALVGRLVELEEKVRLRLRAANGNGHQEPKAEPERWITPDQAGAIAGVGRERIYSWARGQRWASRPSKRCLRISESGFQRWLQRRA